MSFNLNGIENNCNFFSNYYFENIFESDASDFISKLNTSTDVTEDGKSKKPWLMLREIGEEIKKIHKKQAGLVSDEEINEDIQKLADKYINALGYPPANPKIATIQFNHQIPVYLEIQKSQLAYPTLWILTARATKEQPDMCDGTIFNAGSFIDDTLPSLNVPMENYNTLTRILTSTNIPHPRFLLIIGLDHIMLVDRTNWDRGRCFHFDCKKIFAENDESRLKAMTVLLHRMTLSPLDGEPYMDMFKRNSYRHGAGVSEDLKYAMRQAVELIGNEVIKDMQERLKVDLEEHPIDVNELTTACLRYMYGLIFILFLEAKKDLKYLEMDAPAYFYTYSLESLREIVDTIKPEDEHLMEVGNFADQTIKTLYRIIYKGHPGDHNSVVRIRESKNRHDDSFTIDPLPVHLFDPDYTKLVRDAVLSNRALIKIIRSISCKGASKQNDSKARISYASLGINQMGAVYEALLSYRGFIAEEKLIEVKQAGAEANILATGYFAPYNNWRDYDQQNEIARHKGAHGQNTTYDKGDFIYRLTGREREQSASYYTPESLTECLVKYALRELLKGKTAEEILHLKICEPAMGSAAFLNEVINQISEKYLELKQIELNDEIEFDDKLSELQKVKMFIADRNVYGVDLNPIAADLAEVTLLLNTISEGGFVPWFNTQLMNGNTLVGARRQVYDISQLKDKNASNYWLKCAPKRLGPKTNRAKTEVYHFLLGDLEMSNYAGNKIIKSIAKENIDKIKKWNKEFTEPFNDIYINELQSISAYIDDLWEKHISILNAVEQETTDSLSIYGRKEPEKLTKTTIKEKDMIYESVFDSKRDSDNWKNSNATPYVRLKRVMDYWCSLWFWPLEEADKLPNRRIFLTYVKCLLGAQPVAWDSMDIINENKRRKAITKKSARVGKILDNISKIYEDAERVNMATIHEDSKSLNIAERISEEQHFFHWELNFANIFKDKGGFDLILGNPPWVRLEWKEMGILSEQNPMFAIKKLNATEIAVKRNEALKNAKTKLLYLHEYENVAGMQNFLGSSHNYDLLKGMKINLYKCFLPQAWDHVNENGIVALLHPEGIYDDPHGSELREKVYARLLYHFQFENRKGLFSDVDGHIKFSINIYGPTHKCDFKSINN
ncbi:MAG: N-6 DNA methylase, partial [Christensenellaceae bacterium]|nr:N-6 DNA methylase [Christensenellaceae bacterium]